MAEKRQIGIPDEPLDYTSDFITKPYDLDDTRGYEDQKHEVLSGELKRTVVGENWKIPTESQTQERRPQVVQALEGLERGIGDIIKGFLPQEQIKWRTDPVGAAAGWGAALSAPVLVGGAALVEGAESMFPETLGTLKPKESKELTREKLEQVWEDTLQKESQKLEKARTDLESGKISQGQYDAMEKQFDTLVGRRQKAFENIDKYNATVQALDGTPYPNAKIADAVVSESARYLQMRELNNAIEMAQKGIDPESTGFKIGSLAGPTAILGAIGFGGNYLSRYGLSGALRRITSDVETEGGAARLAAIKPVRSRRQAARAGMAAVEVGTEEMESAQYVWQNVQDYIERTGDKTLEYFTPQDAKAFTASAYGAIAGKIETMGGIENIAAGAFRRLGVGGFGRRVLATGGEEWAEEGLQNLSEYLSRRIDGTTDKTIGEALEEALNAAAWGGFMGIGFGTIGGVTYRNARKQGIKVLQDYGLSRETAEKVFDNMIEQTTDAISPRNEPVRENIRKKVSLIYEGADMSPAELEDTIEATTDLEMAMIEYDSANRGIDIADHPLLNSTVNNIGWFRDGIPEQIADQVEDLDNEIGNLRRQLAEENAKEKPDMDKIDDLEAKIEQFYAKLPKEISDLVETDRQKVRQMLAAQSAELQTRQARRKLVRQVQQRAMNALQKAEESDVKQALRRLEQETKTEEKKAKEEERKQRTEQRKLRKAIEKLRQNMTKRKNNLPLSQELFADADLVYQALRDSGFTNQQIANMAEEDIVKAVAPYGISPVAKQAANQLAGGGLLFQEQFDLANENARLDDIYPAYDGETIVVDGVERTVYNSEGQRINKSAEALTNFWRWFGDSKVVDSQGRPIVMYHGTSNTFDSFDPTMFGYATDSGFFGSGFYFTPIESEARYYGKIVMPVYLKIEKPFVISTGGYYSGLYDNLFEGGGEILKDLGLLSEKDLKDFNKYQKLKNEFLKKAKVEKVYTYDAKHNEVQVWSASFEKNGRTYEGKSYRPWDEIGYNEKEDTKENALNNAWGEYAHFNDLNFLIQDLSFTDYIRTNGLAEELSKIIKSRGYDGTIAGDEHIAFEPTQIKSTENSGAFSSSTGNIYYQDDPFSVAEENARLDDIYPAYEGETIEVDGKERTVYNSNGDRIAKSKEALTNFWRWFGDSKVVDSQGRPLVVYHGSRTEQDFDTFDKRHQLNKKTRTGFWFGTENIDYGKNVKSVYLKLENPFVFDAKKSDYYDLPTDNKKLVQDVLHSVFGDNYIVSEKETLLSDYLTIYAKNQNNDGVIIRDVKEGNTHILMDDFVAFEPTQIKSVDNRGTYSADTGNILYQTEVYDGLTTTKIWNVMRTLRGLKDSSTERLLYDKQKDTWFLENADNATHVQMFIKAFNQGNYPEFNNEREAEQYFQENYLADDQRLLQFLAQKYDRPEDAKQAMEHTLGTDEYTNAYLRDNLVVYSRYETDLSETDFPLETFDHYKVEYDENNNREIKLVEKAKESYIEPVKDKPIDPRDRIPKVRGGWTKEKILRYLKNYGSRAGAGIAAREIANFDSVEDFMNHVFYHGARYGTSGRMQPSIVMSDREVERIGGGGYGEKYWAISITKSKKVAGNFATSMGGGNIYPVLLAKNAKVIEMPELTDSADLDDHIVDLYEKGVDAVWIGDKNAGEQELAVINPRALINIGRSEYYGAYKLGSEENPIRLNTKEDFQRIFDFAKDYKNKDETTRLEEAKRTVLWQGKKANGLEPQTRVSGKGKDFRGFYAPELRLISLAQNADPTTLAHELAHDWMQQFFRWYRSGKASESFMQSWGALEKALGISPDDINVPEKASEAFARAYEAWVMTKTDWEKGIDIDDENRDKIIELFKRYQGYLTDIYEDLNNPYFLETWGETGKLKPELQAWFDNMTLQTDLIAARVATGAITPQQAQAEITARNVNQVVTAAEDNFTEKEKEEIAAVERMNDTSRYEVKGGNKNSLQNRLSGLARDIDANNIALGRYDTHRDMLAVAQAADEFVRTRRDEALNIINGLEPEKEGLYASDLYTALERVAMETNDVDLAMDLVNSKVAKDLAKEWGQRVAGFRNFTGDGEFDAISQIKSLDNKYKKDYDEKGKERVKSASDEFVKELDKTDSDQDLDSFFDSVKCQ